MRGIPFGGIYNGVFKVEEWNVGTTRQPITDFLKPDNRPKISWLPAPDRGKFFADPFGLIRKDRLFIICEEFDYYRGKGRIVSFEQIGDQSFSKARAVIELPIHMSYPYLLEYKGQIYCIPETFRAREVSLYRAEEFPYRWEKVTTLLNDFPGVDPTVFEFGGKWWLACVNEEDHSWEKLFIWHADDIGGPWRYHKSNPVKVDIHSSRPAGTPFVYQDQLYRPAQDCSRTYGGGIVLNRITKLTTEEFKEEPIIAVEPFSEPYVEGLHTISSAGAVTVIDGKRLRFISSLSELRHNLTLQRRSFLRRVGLMRS